jgi:hypothetical protein
MVGNQYELQARLTSGGRNLVDRTAPIGPDRVDVERACEDARIGGTRDRHARGARRQEKQGADNNGGHEGRRCDCETM